MEAGAAGMLTGFVADDGDVSPPDEDMAGGDWQPVRKQAANNIPGNHVFMSLAMAKYHEAMLLKLARSSASSQSNVVLFSGSSPSFLHSSVK